MNYIITSNNTHLIVSSIGSLEYYEKSQISIKSEKETIVLYNGTSSFINLTKDNFNGGFATTILAVANIAAMLTTKSIDDIVSALSNISIDADTINLNTDTLESLITQTNTILTNGINVNATIDTSALATHAKQTDGNNLLTDIKAFFTNTYNQVTNWFSVKVINTVETNQSTYLTKVKVDIGETFTINDGYQLNYIDEIEQFTNLGTINNLGILKFAPVYTFINEGLIINEGILIYD